MLNAIYDVNGLIIAAILFPAMGLMIEAGYRLGKARRGLITDPVKSQFSAIQGSLLGLVSLLLGFTFSMANHHYDKRNEAVVEEANAIGSTYLRASDLPLTVKAETLSTLETYVDLRINLNKLSTIELEARDGLLQNANALRTKLWTLAMRAVEVDDRITTTGLYIQALNDLIDASAVRDEIINRHVPAAVIVLLLVTFILAGGVLGYTSGAAGHRPTAAVAGFMVIVIILISMIMDLDRPRRGLIQVSQQNMLALQQEIKHRH